MIRRWYKWLASYGKILRLLFLICSSFIYSMFQGGFVSWFVFYSFLPFAMYGILLFFYSLKKIKISRQLTNTNFRTGDSVEVEIQLQCPWYLPLIYILVEDKLSPKLQKGNQSSKIIFFPSFRKQIVFSYRLDKLERGEHLFQHVALTVGDFIGLFEKELMIPCEDRIVVYPHYELLTHQQLQRILEEGNQVTVNHNRLNTTLISGIRNYVPGDKMSWVHWKATARKNELMTKKFEELASRDAFIVLDQTTSELFEERINFVASVVYSLLQKGVAVAYTNTNRLQQPPLFGRGSIQKEKILHTLVQEEAQNIYRQGESQQFTPYYEADFLLVTAKVKPELLEVINQLKGNNIVTIIVMQRDGTKGEENIPFAKQGIVYRYITPTSYQVGDAG